MGSIPLASDAPGLEQGPVPPQWGLYQNGQPIVLADNVVALSFKATSTISSYPVEQGGFQSYDKVQVPYEARVRFSKGGSVAERTAFWQSIDAAKQSLNTYDLVMPENTFLNANVVDYEFDRKAMTGLGLLFIDVTVEEVRPAGQPQFATVPTNSSTPVTTQPVTNSQNPGANTPQNNGTQQPQTTDQQTQTQVQAPLSNIGAFSGTNPTWF